MSEEWWWFNHYRHIGPPTLGEWLNILSFIGVILFLLIILIVIVVKIMQFRYTHNLRKQGLPDTMKSSRLANENTRKFNKHLQKSGKFTKKGNTSKASKHRRKAEKFEKKANEYKAIHDKLAKK